MIKKEKGITLLALGITIIVLLILSGVAIATLSGENGVIQRTIKARFEQEKAQYQDFIDTAQAKVHMEDWKGEKSAEELLEGIKVNLEAQEYFKTVDFELITENVEEPVLLIQTKEGHQFKVTEEGVKYIGSKEEIGDMGSLTEEQIKITITPTTWTNQKVKININVDNEDCIKHPEGYILQYSTDLKNWTKQEEKVEAEFEIEENATIYAQVINTYLNQTKMSSRGMSRIDTTPPNEFTLRNTKVGENSFELTATFQDSEAEMPSSGVSGLSKIIWYYKRPQDTEWQPEKDENPPMNGTEAGQKEETRSLKIQDLTIGGEVKAYAEAYDVAGNSITSYTKDNPLTFETAKYHIKYDANGGSGAPAEQEKNYGIEITLSSTVPNRTGYTFKGWSADRNASTPTWAAGETYRDNENKTLYAVWKDETKPSMMSLTANPSTWTNGNVTVTGKAQDLGSGIIAYAWTDTATAPSSWTTIAATTNPITPTATQTANGTKYFWVKDVAGNINNTAITISKIDKIAPTAFVLSKSAVGVNSFTLSANFSDATSGLSRITWYYMRPQDTGWQSVTDTYTAINGANAGTVGCVTKTKAITGLTKGGTIKAFAEAWDVAGNKVTSYAAGNPLSFTTTVYTISYNANLGSGAPGAQTKYYGVNISLSSGVPTRTGYTFQGWSASSSATSATWGKGGTYANNESKTLYAVWKANTYTIVYNGNGATGGTTASTTHTYNVAANLRTNGFTKTGYTFAGWATSASGGVAYGNGASVKNLSTGGTVTLYAKWTAHVITTRQTTETYFTCSHPSHVAGGGGAVGNYYRTSGGCYMASVKCSGGVIYPRSPTDCKYIPSSTKKRHLC